MARAPRLGSTVTLYPALVRTSDQMLATMVDSSKFSEPMVMVGLALEARTEARAPTPGRAMARARAPTAPRRRERLNRMSHYLFQ
jgi:hypothetical protein